jgi:acetyl esterase/lipase
MDLNNYLAMKDERFSILFRKDTFESEEDYVKYVKSVSPYHLLDSESKPYPPTFILHGTGDTAVPVEQSYKFAKKLRELGVEVDERYKDGGEHCFENKIEVSLCTASWGNWLTTSDLEMRDGMNSSCPVWIS